MWLDGGTESERSAICYAVAQICSEQHLLSGSFSFSHMITNAIRKHDASGLIATLIYQLLLQIPQTRNLIAEKIAEDISILDRSWEMQLDTLLIQPLVAVAQTGILQDAQHGPRLFIIDGFWTNATRRPSVLSWNPLLQRWRHSPRASLISCSFRANLNHNWCQPVGNHQPPLNCDVSTWSTL